MSAAARRTHAPARPLWALIPLKDPSESKSRLATVLDAQQRHDLATAMAGDVIDALCGARGVDRVMLVAGRPGLAQQVDPERRIDEFVPQAGGMNADLEAASIHARSQGAASVLIVHADLPLLDVGTIEEFISQSPLLLAPCRSSDGTNLLLADLPLAMRLQYGSGSFRRFLQTAHAQSIPAHVLELPAAAFDVDEPDDLLELERHLDRESGVASRTAAWLRTHRYNDAPAVQGPASDGGPQTCHCQHVHHASGPHAFADLPSA